MHPDKPRRGRLVPLWFQRNRGILGILRLLCVPIVLVLNGQKMRVRQFALRQIDHIAVLQMRKVENDQFLVWYQLQVLRVSQRDEF